MTDWRWKCLSLGSRWRRAFGIGALLAVFTLTPHAWSAEPEWLDRAWQTEDGLPDSAITAIQQTVDGYLWVGTPKGLARFDGAHFKVFDSQLSPMPRNRHVSALLADRRGALWIATVTGQLLCYENGIFRTVAQGDPATTLSAKETGQAVLAAAADGGVWLLTGEGGLFCCHANTATRQTVANGLPPGRLSGLCADEAGRIWLVAGNSLYCRHGGKWDKEAGAEELKGPLTARLTGSRRGGVWGNGRSVRRFDAGQWQENLATRPWFAGSANLPATAMMEDHHGRVWLGMLWSGVYYTEGNAPWRRVHDDGALTQVFITCLFEDKQGTVWVGTDHEGLHSFRRAQISVIKPPLAMQKDYITTSCATRDGSIWAGTSELGAFRYIDGTCTPFGKEQGLDSLNVCSILEDRQGNLLVGTWGGLFQLEAGRFKRVARSPTPGQHVLALFEDRAGRLWVGTDNGLACFHEGKWVAQRLLEGSSVLDIRALAEDGGGNLWVGTVGQGLFRLSGDKVTQFCLSSGSPLQNARAIYCDSVGDEVWVGTLGQGLFRFKNGRFTAYTSANGLPSDTIHGMIPDDAGNLWMGSDNGVFYCSLAALKNYQPDTSRALVCAPLLPTDGLLSRGCSGGGQPTACRSPDGHLWFPNYRGLATFDPRSFTVPRALPRMLIESVVVDGAELAPGPGGEVHVKSNVRRFEFHYTVPDLAAPQALRFRYRLEGMDIDWVDAKSQRTAYYSQLPPGHYQFQVMASGLDGQWQAMAAPLLLWVVPRVWELRWVQALAGMILVGIIVGFVMLGKQRKLRWRLARVEHEQAMEQQRSRIARDIHDDLGARATKISLLADMTCAEPVLVEKLRDRLQDIFTASREMVQAMDETVWVVNPSYDTLVGTVEYILHNAEEFFRQTNLQLKMNTPEELPDVALAADTRHNLFMAMKEALHNVLKHSAATEVRIAMTVTGSVFRVVITDNGRGFVAAQDPGRGNGLPGMRQRLEQVGGTCQVRSEPNQGTTVTLELNLGLPPA